MPKDTKTLGNNKARAWESLGFVHKKRLGQRFDTTSSFSKIRTSGECILQLNICKYTRYTICHKIRNLLN